MFDLATLANSCQQQQIYQTSISDLGQPSAHACKQKEKITTS